MVNFSGRSFKIKNKKCERWRKNVGSDRQLFIINHIKILAKKKYDSINTQKEIKRVMLHLCYFIFYSFNIEIYHFT